MYFNELFTKGDVILMSIIERLPKILNENELTVPELATAIGVTKNTIYNIINGSSSPKLSTVIAIAEYLNLDISELIDGKNEVMDKYEDKLLELFRDLSLENKIETIGFVSNLHIKQELKKD